MDVEVRKLRRLRFINIAYIFAFGGLISICKVGFEEYYLQNVYIGLVILLLLVLLLISSFLKLTKIYYEKILLTGMWVVMITAMGISFISFLPMNFNKKIVYLISMGIILLFAYTKCVYNFKIYKAYEESSYSQNKLLANAQEAFALHEIILNKEGKAIDYRYIEINEAFENMIGLSRREVIGKTVLEILPSTEKYWIDIYGEVVLKGVKRKITHYARELGKYYKVSAYPVEKIKFATLFSDVTEKIENERKLKHAVQQSEKADELKNQFLRDVNHRLRTPLNGMMGMVQLVDGNKIGEENKELFEAMKLEMYHSRNIINQISKYVDIQGMNFEFSKNDISQLISDEIEKIVKSDIHVELIEKCCEKTLIYIEKNVMQLVFKELMTNAMKHTKNGRVDVEVDFRWNKKKILEYVIIKVKDYGEGIIKEELKYIFNEFYHHDFINIYRGEAEISVPMCKQMLVSSGGDLLVYSEIGKGTTFTMLLSVY